MSKVKIEIKNRWTEEILFEYEEENNDIKQTLEKAFEKGANLTRANLMGAYLEEANLMGAYLEEANLMGANLMGANLRGANLMGANLMGANLRGANLMGANLMGANLMGANLMGANLTRANLTRAYLEEAYLEGAYIFLQDTEIDVEGVIADFEKNSDLKINKTYINKDIITYYSCTLWKYGLIIQEWEVKKKEPEIKKLTLEDIKKELGYDFEFVGIDNE